MFIPAMSYKTYMENISIKRTGKRSECCTFIKAIENSFPIVRGDRDYYKIKAATLRSSGIVQETNSEYVQSVAPDAGKWDDPKKILLDRFALPIAPEQAFRSEGHQTISRSDCTLCVPANYCRCSFGIPRCKY